MYKYWKHCLCICNSDRKHIVIFFPFSRQFSLFRQGPYTIKVPKIPCFKYFFYLKWMILIYFIFVSFSAFNEFVLCKFIHVTRDCGQEAADFLQQHLDRISSPLIHEHCAHYTYAEGSCRVSSSTRTHLICLHVILLALLSLWPFFSVTDRIMYGNTRI